MEGDNNIPHTPWSRHLEVKIKPGNNFKGNKVDNYKKRKATWESRRKAISESVFNSPKNRSGVSPRYVTNGKSGRPEDNVWQKDKGSSTYRTKKIRQPIQGRAAGKCPVRRTEYVQPCEDDLAKRNPDLVVQIAEEVVSNRDDNICNPTPRYVQTYYNMLHYACMTPYKWGNIPKGEQTKCRNALEIIRKMCCYYIAFLASFTSFTMIKYEAVNFVEDRTLNQLIEIGYFLVSGTVHWYLTYVIWFRYDKISNTFISWEKHDTETCDVESSAERRKNQEWLPCLNAAITLSMAIIKGIMYTDLKNWSIEGLILDNSLFVSYGLFIWTPDNMRDETLVEQYGTKLNARTYAMGIFGTMSYICWNLQIDCFKDLLIWVTTTNSHHIINFGIKIRDSLSRKKSTGKNTTENDEQCWKAYRDVLAVNNSTNACYSNMLIINHLDTILVSSYCLTEVLNKDGSLRPLIFLGYNVIKAILPYLSARIAAKENEPCRKWIQSLPCQTERFRVDDTPYTRDVMLVEMDKEPLGLGRGKVHISNEFLVSLITFVASLFCFLLNIKPKEEEDRLIY